MSGESGQDQLALTFIAEAANGFRGFATDPGSEITCNRLVHALEALERIPTIGPGVTEAVRPELGKRALASILGPMRTWMHKSLGGITDEARFNDAPLVVSRRRGSASTSASSSPISITARPNGSTTVSIARVDRPRT